MKKRFLAIFLSMVMVVFNLTTVVFAAEGLVENRLKDSHRDIYAGNNFESFDDLNLYNPLGLKVNLEDSTADFSYWHFVDSTSTSQYADITFEKPDGSFVTWENIQTCETTQVKNHHYAVITPSSWKLADGVSYAAASGQFNLSHSGMHKAVLGKVMVNATVTPWHNEITPHEYYERDVKEFYERDVDQFYERTVDEYYEIPIIHHYAICAQKYLIPVFTRKLAATYNDTMVTRLNYDGDTAKAKPTNGGAFKNGHTYVAVNVAEASSEEGIYFTIADSSKNNGKKTPDEYNRPIDYQYNVKIADGKLTITCDNRLAYASVGAYVYANAPKDAKNAPKHYDNTVTVDLPKGYGDVVYLYTHFESLGWYETDKNDPSGYEFKEWRYDNARTVIDDHEELVATDFGERELVETVYGEYELVKTVNGEYVLADTQYGEYVLVDTMYGEYGLVDTIFGEYELVDTKYSDYELVKTEYGAYELVNNENVIRRLDDKYTSTLILTVNGEVKPLNESFELEPGDYEFTITSSGNEFEPVTKIVTIIPGENPTVDFGTIEYQLADVMLPTVRHESNRNAEKNYVNRAATEHYANKEATEHFTDLLATEHYANKETEKHYANKEATEHFTDLPVTEQIKESDTPVVVHDDGINYDHHSDKYLGTETDPFGEYAIRE